jgi:hypothetical protein
MYSLNYTIWGYNVEEKLYLGVREQKRWNTTALDHSATVTSTGLCFAIIFRYKRQIEDEDYYLLRCDVL